MGYRYNLTQLISLQVVDHDSVLFTVHREQFQCHIDLLFNPLPAIRCPDDLFMGLHHFVVQVLPEGELRSLRGAQCVLYHFGGYHGHATAVSHLAVCWHWARRVKQAKTPLRHGPFGPGWDRFCGDHSYGDKSTQRSGCIPSSVLHHLLWFSDYPQHSGRFWFVCLCHGHLNNVVNSFNGVFILFRASGYDTLTQIGRGRLNQHHSKRAEHFVLFHRSNHVFRRNAILSLALRSCNPTCVVMSGIWKISDKKFK